MKSTASVSTTAAMNPGRIVVLASCIAISSLAGCIAGGPLGEPGDDLGGNNAPGNNAPGNNTPGNNDPGNNTPGNNDPGNNDPGPGVDPLLPPQCVPSAEVCDALDNDCNGEVDDGLACACLVDTSCYSGPAQTRQIGACTDGARVCDGEFFGPCEGSQGPIEEICEDDIDNDCDGNTDEGACREVCTIGDERACYEGDPALAGVGICDEGRQVCNDERRWGPCVGSVLPGAEICDDGLDNDCDGTVDSDCNDDLPEEVERFTIDEQIEDRPVDFIMVVDNSGSMRDTVRQVEMNLGAFATRLVDSDIDYRFVMIALRGTDPNEPDVCVQPPMSGGSCSNSARFRHASQEVDSHSAYQDLLACHGGCGRNNGQRYGDFLRSDSLKQIIIVSDDESDTDWPTFRDRMRGLVGDFILNGVVGLRSGDCVENIGARYIAGAEETGGELLNICDNDWGQVIDVLFNATLSRLSATFPLARQPIVDTIRVLTSTGGAEQEQVGNWVYSPERNTISFTDTAGLAGGVTVIVRYKAR